jgi:hypothetical protein
MTDPTCPRTFVLRNLPCAARLTLAAFLISVGIGYLSALVQLHFQHAKPGSLMPTGEDAKNIFSGDKRSQIEKLITADENQPFNGTGQMVRAFTRASEGWKTALKKRTGAIANARRGKGAEPNEAEAAEAEAAIRKERETERDAVVAWIRAGASREVYEINHFPLPDHLANVAITDFYLVKDDNDKPVLPRAVKIRTILTERCARCHAPDGQGKAVDFPLHDFDHLQSYVIAKGSTAMSLTKLAQTTHVHLLGFSMLYGLTGLILAFSSYPRFLRVLVCPLPLVAQVADISLWWLARLDEPLGPQLAQIIPITGGIVAMGLFLHIALGLWDLFSWRGKLILVLLAGAAGFGAYVAKEKVIDPYISQEARPTPTVTE